MTAVDSARGKLRALVTGAGSGLDGRVVVLGAVVLYLCLVAVARIGWEVDVWPWLGVPSGPSLFFDARNVAAAAECSRLGHDPLVDNPCDPWGRTIFYPRIWLVLGSVGLDQGGTLVFGALIVAIFVLMLLVLLPRLTVGEGLIVAAAACSPAVMFAVERANMDLVIFSGLALAAVVWRRGSAAARYVAIALVLLMAVAKLYPAIALLAFLPSRDRRTRIAAAAALVLFGAYAVTTRDDIATISERATQGQEYSYGARILLGQIYHAVVGGEWGGSRAIAQALVFLAVALLAVGAWLVWRHRSPTGHVIAPLEDARETSELLAFRMGALVYLGTFVVGNSFDYRLVCLLLVLPQLLRWPVPRGADGPGRLVRATLAVVVLLLWIGALAGPLRLWDELVSWTAAGLLATLLVLTLPSLPAALRPHPVDR